MQLKNVFGETGRLFKEAVQAIVLIFVAAAVTLLPAGCGKDIPSAVFTENPDELRFESTGEEFLISALNEIDEITEYFIRNRGILQANRNRTETGSFLPPKNRKMVLFATATDTTYIYGELTAGGYGAVVTERHAYPKGILLITVRKSYGKRPSNVVTETKRYITEEDFLDDTTQQSNITEVFGLSSDTIVTHVTRNGVIETYTFRLPVITRTVDSQDGSVRVTTRYGAGGAVYTETRDGYDNLIQLRSTQGDSTGSVITYTAYPDSSWRNLRVLGQADGSILREITTGP